MAGHPEGAPEVKIKTLRVSAAGQSHEFSFTTTGKTAENMGWTTKTWAFTAIAGVTFLEFRSLTNGAYGPALDNVGVVQAAPLPPLLLLLLD
jgi:hypothetical protein